MTRKVTIITATTGNPLLQNCLESVKKQTYQFIQHLVFVDGPDRVSKAYSSLNAFMDKYPTNTQEYNLDIIDLPYPVGIDRWNGHRMYGAGTYLAEGEFIIFLDDDNALEPNHVENCLKVIDSGNQWAYSLRSITNNKGEIIGYDNCESLGKWASVIDPRDFFIDVNCYFLPRMVAINMSPVWFRKFREPGMPEIDRVMCGFLRQYFPTFDCTYDYGVRYTVGNTGLSVTPEFFEKGNEEMLRRYKGQLPWKK